MGRIDFCNETDYQILSEWISRLEAIFCEVEDLLPDSVISLVLVDNEKMRALNYQYSGIDSPTDVLSFPESDVDSEYQKFFAQDVKNNFLGEIVIAVDVMREQSIRYGVSEDREFARLAIHGFLHLLGYDHQNPDDTVIMKKKEEILFSKW